jgi:hypothetical protein
MLIANLLSIIKSRRSSQIKKKIILFALQDLDQNFKPKVVGGRVAGGVISAVAVGSVALG